MNYLFVNLRGERILIYTGQKIFEGHILYVYRNNPSKGKFQKKQKTILDSFSHSQNISIRSLRKQILKSKRKKRVFSKEVLENKRKRTKRENSEILNEYK